MADEQNWAVPVLAGVVVLGLAAAHGIDTSQWSPRFRQAPASGVRSSTAPASSSSRARPAVTAAVTLTPPLGIEAGAPAGALTARVSTVIVQTSVDTCWTMVVDGSAMKGCGPAAVTDTRGTPATTVTRTSGATPVRVEIVRGGRSVADASLTTTGRPLVLSAR
jgi:hypothetical protein